VAIVVPRDYNRKTNIAGKSSPTGGHAVKASNIFSEEVAAKICNHVANGGSLRELRREDATVPTYYIMAGWMAQNPVFEEQYRAARMMHADTLFDEMLDISNTPINGIMTVERANGNTEITKKDAIDHRRLQVDTRKWIVERLAPRKYGNKISAEISGPDGQPLQISNISDELRVKALADFIAKTKGLPPPEEK
jgi:hypothetical protein